MPVNGAIKKPKNCTRPKISEYLSTTREKYIEILLNGYCVLKPHTDEQFFLDKYFCLYENFALTLVFIIVAVVNKIAV